MNARAYDLLRLNRVIFRRPPLAPLAPYYAYHPENSTSVLVSVHGISRNAREHAYAFAALAERLEVSLVCPVFEPDVFPDYQRLGREGLGARADLALDAILADFAGWAGFDFCDFNLSGFSGGAQFAHRYALAYPMRIRRLVLTAPGWFTFPDSPRQFPWGPRATSRLPGLDFDVETFLDIPMRVMVGRQDCARDKSLRVGKRIDAEQGRNRLARARNWVRAVNARAAAHGKPEPAKLCELGSCSHDFTEALQHGMDGKLAEFLSTGAAKNTTTAQCQGELS